MSPSPRLFSTMSLDAIVPGQPHSVDNIQWVCRRVNLAKYDFPDSQSDTSSGHGPKRHSRGVVKPSASGKIASTASHKIDALLLIGTERHQKVAKVVNTVITIHSIVQENHCLGVWLR